MNNEYFVGKNVLVTGGSGFIGSALIDRLISLGARITAFYHTVDFQRPLFGQMTVGSPPLAYAIERTVVGDLRSPSDLREAVSASEPDIVFHLGGLTQVTEAKGRWYDAAMIKTIGTINVLEAILNIAPNCDIVVASTDKVYGKGDETTHFRTFDDLKPDHPYDASKAAADIIARAFSQYHDFPLQITRMANVYGPGDTNWKRIIPYAIRRTMQGKVIQLRSDGMHVRQYLYIDDAVDAFLDIAFEMGTDHLFPRGRAWNIAPVDSHTVLDLVGTIQIIMSERGYDVVGSEILNTASDEASWLRIEPSLFQGDLGRKPKVPIRLGIENTVDWMTDFFNREMLYG